MKRSILNYSKAVGATSIAPSAQKGYGDFFLSGVPPDPDAFDNPVDKSAFDLIKFPVFRRTLLL